MATNTKTKKNAPADDPKPQDTAAQAEALPCPSPETTSPFDAADTAKFKQAIFRHLTYTLARDLHTAQPHDWWIATTMAVREHILARLIKTQGIHNRSNVRRLYYFSLEYLMGRLTENNLYNTGLYKAARDAIKDPDISVDFETMINEEADMGLGNGGLGRLASCFLDSLATLDLPAIGYGIYYEFGLFRQEFVNGAQVEHPDSWMIGGTPWAIPRPENKVSIPIKGRVENVFDDRGNYRSRWVDTITIIGIPHDIPIAGYDTDTVNLLRLWSSRSASEFDLNAFNSGGYVEAVREKAVTETISKVLYPNDKTENGKELRLIQQYFFVACSLRDIMRRHFRNPDNTWDNFPDKVAIQLNDTHPAVAVPELMRILLDEEELPWEKAWAIVTRVFAYTNHTLLPEALEKWNVTLFERILPRHLQIIYAINDGLLRAVEARWPGDNDKKRDCSLIEENGGKSVRMASLSVVASHAVNGVAALHTELLKKLLFPQYDALFPGRFQNKTNGITPRRWLLNCNPRLSKLITDTLGSNRWPCDLDTLRALEKHAPNAAFQRAFMDAKRANKTDLAAIIKTECGIDVLPDALYDVQIKRLHEYKRQHLNLLHILALYRRLLQDPALDIVPRVFIFGAKAAPGYDLAKNIIRAINIIGARINADTRIGGKIKVVFLPNYRVTLAEKIIPAADLSEQISTAGKEASGTGNMKLALNGAITIGTLDGANVEIKEEVGDDNIFIFGMNVDEVQALRARGYNPWDYYNKDDELRALVDWIGSDYFAPGEHGAFAPLHDSLLQGGDPFMVLADFRAYSDAHQKADALYRDKSKWARAAILNTARVGKFSSDRTIREYADQIWRLPKSKV